MKFEKYFVVERTFKRELFAFCCLGVKQVMGNHVWIAGARPRGAMPLGT